MSAFPAALAEPHTSTFDIEDWKPFPEYDDNASDEAVAHEERFERFARLAKKWRDETSMSSSITKKINHPAYLEIIEMGPDVVSFILDELEVRPAYWFVALEKAAKTSPVLPEDAQDFEKSARAWIKWGRSRGR